MNSPVKRKESELKRRLLENIKNRKEPDYHLPIIGQYYPSQLSRYCLRDAYNWYQGYSKGFPDEVLLTLEHGIMCHRWLQERLGFVEVEKKVEMRFNDFIIIGSVDAIDKNGVVWELKDRPLKAIPSTPEYSHLLQIEFYLKAVRARKGIICYFKTFNQVAEFEVVPDKQRWNKIITAAHNLHVSLMADIPPPCICGRCKP